jgi:hypothetical protein
MTTDHPLAEYGWTSELSQQAQQEGWDLFWCDSEDHAPWEVQALDEEAILPSDEAAWERIIEGSAKGDKLHLTALRALQAESPEEFDLIARYAAEVGMRLAS